MSKQQLTFILLVGSLLGSGQWGKATALTRSTITDNPDKLVLEFSPGIQLVRDSLGVSLQCRGCAGEEVEGAPQLPYLDFQVIAGRGEPAVVVEDLGVRRAVLDKGIPPVPEPDSMGNPVYRKDPTLYRKAMSLKPRVGPVRYFRGHPVRRIAVPLVKWDEAGKTAEWMDSLRVTVRFPNPAANPVSIGLPGHMQRELANPKGGAYQMDPPPHRLPKSSSAFREGFRTRPRRTENAMRLSGPIPLPLVKIAVGDSNVESLSEDGVYEISYAGLEAALSVTFMREEVVGVAVEDLHLYTGINTQLRVKPDSLPIAPNLREIPMEVLDNNDNGTFDRGDVLRFFGHGTSSWIPLDVRDSLPFLYTYETNPYSFRHYYFLSFRRGGSDGLRLQTAASDGGGGTASGTSWGYLRAERDLTTGFCNLSGEYESEMGREWYWHTGNPHCNSNFTLTLSGSQIRLPEGRLPDYLPGTAFYLSVFTTGNNQGTFELTYEDTSYSELSVPGNNFRVDSLRDPNSFSIEQLQWSSSQNRTSVDYGMGFVGYNVVYQRRNAYNGSPLRLFPLVWDTTQTLSVTGTSSGVRVLKLEDGVAVSRLPLENGAFRDRPDSSANVQYYLYETSHIREVPARHISLEAPQDREGVVGNLVEGPGRVPEYLIIAPDSLLASAVELKRHREDDKRWRTYATEVVRVEDIYREFSSGRLSPVAIRDFVRWVYYGWRAGSAPDSGLQYLLLFGDGHFNYRGIVRQGIESDNDLSNPMPPYEYGNMSTDDFFGYMDPGEVPHNFQSVLDLSVGRIPVSSVQEAAGFLEKIKAYEDPSQAGSWRNRLVSTADDNFQLHKGETYDPIRQGHTNDAETFFNNILEVEPGKKVDKVYLLDYEHNFNFDKPEAAQDLLNLLNRGTLLVNYIGHGGTTVWADEGLLVRDKALPKLSNQGKTGLYTVFSCTVGRFDKITENGLSEALIYHAGVGAIATVSATRESFVGPNLQLASRFFPELFKRDDLGDPQTLGDALRIGKAPNSAVLNNEKYGIFGEPVTYIRKPHLSISPSNAPDTIRAKECGTLSGSISGGSGNGFVQAEFFGARNLKVYPARVDSDGDIRNDEQRASKSGEILFGATVPYKNGKFSMPTIFKERVPFGDTTAELRVFAWDREQEREGSYWKGDIVISGVADNCTVEDTEGPRISVTGCQRAQTSSLSFDKKVRLPIPYCLEIIVTDSLGGVQTADRPDEGTTVEVVGEGGPAQPNLSEDGFLRKTFKWSFGPETQPGNYLLKVRAQDGFGNLSQQDLEVELTNNDLFSVYKVFNAPNPVKDRGTCFYFGEIAEQFDGNFSETEPEIQADVKIYNQRGLLIQELRDVQARTELDANDEFSCRQRNAWWNLRDRWGNRQGNGTYIYKIKVRQTGLNNDREFVDRLSSKTNTLVISR